MLCKHCGAYQDYMEQRGIATCAPPFTVQPHEFTKPHPYLTVELSPLEDLVIQMVEFIQSIEREWIEFDAAEEGEWNDGYEDALGDLAKRARKVLEKIG